ncbi:thiol-disulfide isomerase/thioredoxin [Mycetocola sp. BIGb0189]|uniref:thioredoxin family protein n=1 Tax=Mycetocola sp. BIGb0189 TaxID=2940604 RepID=UPI0021675559|nr:thioredoxin family protein [Mycetocola sp. BIGb0189]MCS4275201.1 thiol-disulfide isomerase/thioredoxin [Mycetocola sp. BIGb0189]
MSPLTGLAFLAGLVVLSLVIGLVLRARNGRVTHPAADDRLDPGLFGVDALGSTATVVQFSTEVCARCPGTKRLLTALADEREGVDFVHVDVTHDPALASRFNLLQTPTVLVLDGAGRTSARLSGVIARESVIAELDVVGEGTRARG